MRIAIRADASQTIGTGHIMRMLTLAQACNEDAVTFYLYECPVHLLAMIEAVATVEWLPSLEIQAFITRCRDAVIILDHYGITASDERLITQNTRGYLIAIDDTYTPHDAPCVINPNIYAKAEKYPKRIKYLGGAPFSLLRSEFFAHQTQSIRYELLITLGGSTLMHPLLRRILTALSRFKSWRCCVVLGGNEPFVYHHLPQHITVLARSEQMAMLMRQSRCVICAGGGTIKEALALKKPILALRVANNQRYNMAYVQQHRLAWVRNWQNSTPINKIADDINSFLKYRSHLLRTRVEKKALEFGATNVVCDAIKALV